MSSKKGGSKAPQRKTFQAKLYEILQSEDPAIISWNEDGTVILIHDKERLSKEVLGKYFRSSQYESFVRQLSFYQFRRTGLDRSKSSGDGPEGPIMEFVNDKFTRENPNLGLTIKRKTYSVDDVKDEVLGLKSDMTKVKSGLTEVRGSVQKLQAQFEDMRRALLQVLQNQHHLHLEQRNMKVQQGKMMAPLQQAAANKAVKPEKGGLVAGTGGGAAKRKPANANATAATSIPGKPFGAKSHSLDNPDGSFAMSVDSGSLNGNNLDGRPPSNIFGSGTMDSFNFGSGDSFAFGSPSTPTVDGGPGIEQLLDFDDLTISQPDPLLPNATNGSGTGGGGSDAGQSFRVPVQPTKRLRGRGMSQVRERREETARRNANAGGNGPIV